MVNDSFDHENDAICNDLLTLSHNNEPAESAVMSLVSLATDAMVVIPFLD